MTCEDRGVRVMCAGSEGEVRGSEDDVSATVQDVPAVSHWQTRSSSPSP